MIFPHPHSFQAYPEFTAHLEKLAGAIHPLLDSPPVDIPGVMTGSLKKRLSAAKTLMPVLKCGVFIEMHFKNIFLGYILTFNIFVFVCYLKV